VAQVPKKVAVIGLDAALPHLIEKHIAEGQLPTFKKLIEGGVIADNCLVPFPTVTPPNWATIATGAWPGTHGITDFHVPIPGTTPHSGNAVQAMSSDRWLAEPIWDAADKAGKKCIVLNYPGSWPNHMEHGIMVGGAGLSAGQWRDGIRGIAAAVSLCHDQMITTGPYPRTIRARFEPAENWQHAPEMGKEPLETDAQLQFPGAHPKPPKTTWHVLVRQSGDAGYDMATLSPTKDLDDAFCTLKVGEWSPTITTKIRMDDGAEREVFFRCKLIELSPDAEDFRFLIGCMCETSGWSSPPEVAKEIVSKEGTFAFDGGMIGYAYGWFGFDTYVEISEQYTQWVEDAAVTLLTKHDWDVFFMHCHPPDWLYHVLITDLYPETCPDEAKRQAAWEAHLKVYQAQDKMIASILEVMGKDTLVILVSDHGATPDGPTFNPFDALVPAGLAVLVEEEVDDGLVHMHGTHTYKPSYPVPAQTKALPQREIHIYVNLKGRDPEGIVEPEDYEKVQQQIIDALYTYVDPRTGKRPVSLALSKKDARILGLHGDRIGDVIYAIYPWFGAQHGPILPTGEWGPGRLAGLLVFNGPGVKKGYRLQRTCGLTDVVPTICYLMDLPVPEQVEGGVLYQVFKDPDFKLKEIQKLKDGLARMETALARQEREPWDKHDCA